MVLWEEGVGDGVVGSGGSTKGSGQCDVEGRGTVGGGGGGGRRVRSKLCRPSNITAPPPPHCFIPGSATDCGRRVLWGMVLWEEDVGGMVLWGGDGVIDNTSEPTNIFGSDVWGLFSPLPSLQSSPSTGWI